MIWTRQLITASAVLASLVVLLGAGCEREAADSKTAHKPWRFESQLAPYAIEVPGEWQKTPSETLNQFADLALTVSDRFYAVVIPQELPQYEGVPSQEASALKRASLSLLRKRIDKFEIQREGALTLDQEPALSIFAEGMHKGKPVQYITTYATRDDFGYQIVAWGPRKQQEGLVQAVDELLAGWQFPDKASSTSQIDRSDETTPAADDPAQP